MKKYTLVFCLTVALAMTQTAFSQDLILRFTGAKTDGSYVRLDSVTVQNINCSWTETAAYPDTVLIFKLSGISTAQDIAADIVAYPNPFSGATNVAVTMPQSGDATMQVFNLAGQKVMERAMKLESGENLFEVHLQEPEAGDEGAEEDEHEALDHPQAPLGGLVAVRGFLLDADLRLVLLRLLGGASGEEALPGRARGVSLLLVCRHGAALGV